MAHGFAAPRAKQGDQPLPEIVISQFEPLAVDIEWLDDPDFQEFHNDNPDVVVWRSNERPKPRNLDLPPSIKDRVSNTRRMLALQFAKSEYTEPMQNLVSMQLEEFPNSDANVKFLRRELTPFLKACKFFELQYQNRPKVIRDIDNRMREIEKLKLTKEIRDELDPPEEPKDDINRPYRHLAQTADSISERSDF
jgi:hypothetical protein